MFDFKSESDEELGFRKGDEVEILEELDENWWKGRLDGREGLFPATYVQILDKWYCLTCYHVKIIVDVWDIPVDMFYISDMIIAGQHKII